MPAIGGAAPLLKAKDRVRNNFPIYPASYPASGGLLHPTK
jgi:hypothetical protein